MTPDKRTVASEPGTPTAWALAYDHAHGTDISLHSSEAKAYAALAEIARTYWDDVAEYGDLSPVGDPGELDDMAVIRHYFDVAEDERWQIEELPIN